MSSLLEELVAESENAMLTLAEAAASLGVEPDTLRRQHRLGRLKATLVGKTYVVSEREVERYRRENLGRRGRPPKDA